ncbi:peptidylprolyl isomerase [Nitrospinaceae bacterium]|nr:peptidylprolyl isomerase [Nitrospinaceae bacterium]
MSLFPFINRHFLYASAFLIAFSGIALAKNKSEFTINGKPAPKVVASVNGTKLSSELLKREMIAYRLLANRQGENIETEDEGKIAQGLLMKAIDDELIYQEGLKQNINIDSATIDRELNHIQSQFPDKKLFLAALAAQRLTFDVLKKNIKKTLVKDEFVRTNIAPKVQVIDDKVKSFYDKNKATFIKPETFKISHIYVSIPDPGDGQAESKKDRAKAREIIDWVKNEARKKINLALLALKKGKPFASVAKEFSEDPKTSVKGGDLGFMMKNQTLPEVSSAMVELKVGEISSVIESSLGFHIIQLTEKKESHLIALDEVKPDILNHLLKLETEKQLKSYLSGLRKKSAIKIFI